jgi:2,5-diamino-6-(ribosylamino)-4(3H)-pyrimidinone 5'-phosphate reductase
MNVTVNAAMSVDGKLSSRRREQIKISGSDDFDRVDEIRTAVDGIMVGIGTVLADDPHLVLDDPDGRRERRQSGRPTSPARIVVDSRGRTPPDGRICDDAATTYILVSSTAPEERRQALRKAGAELIVAGDERVDLPTALDQLAEAGIEQLLIEGGGELIYSAFDENLVDELTVFVGSLLIGGREAPTLADGDGFTETFPRLSLNDVKQVDDGVVLCYDTENK